MGISFLYCNDCGSPNQPDAKFCSSCGKAMQTFPSLPQTPSSQTGLLVPNHILKQQYRLIGRLGKGGMGAVYRAEDIKFNNRLVAVKEMGQKNLNSQEIIQAADAFKREALLLAGFRHPNLPRIYDHFSESGRWYLVMDFIEGETLLERLHNINGGYLPVEEVIDIGIQLCAVLSYLHAHQPPIIFRDLKPSNIMKTPDGHIYLIDFGIARHFRSGQMIDTVVYASMGYAAPEQYGTAQTTPRSDIYSLGVTLHQSLTGNNPLNNLPTMFDFPPIDLHGHPASLALQALLSQMLNKVESVRPDSHFIRQELERISAMRIGQPGVTILPPTQPDNLPLSPQAPTVAAVPPLGTPLSVYRGHSGWVNSISWSPDGTCIASASDDKTVQVWEVATMRTISTYNGHSGTVLTVAWSPDNRLIASGGSDQSVKVWDSKPPSPVTTQRKFIFTRRLSTDNPTWFILPYKDRCNIVNAVAWSPNGTHIVLASQGVSLSLDTSSERYNERSKHYAPDYYKITQIRDLTTAKSIVDCKAHGIFQNKDYDRGGYSYYYYYGVNDVEWSPNGTRIASACEDKTVQIFDTVSGKKVFTYEGHSDWVQAVAWSPDGKRIASAGNDGTVHVFDATNGNTIFIYRQHVGSVRTLAWSPGGSRIASAGWDKRVHVWRAV